ncbi:cobalamin-dependent protein, partial [Chloroflexota bacterium]
MKVLFLYPRYPVTFWSLKHALKIISKKAISPPLGLLTVAALLPSEWDKKLVDLNTDNLKDRDISWADYVFVSAMDIQRASVREVISRCVQLGTKVVAGGPLFTTSDEEFEGVDCLVRGEFEEIAPQFVADMENRCLQRVYEAEQKPDMQSSPVPEWNLIDIKKYASLSIQY